ncbi:uncharacterized protein DUF1275 [Deinococcus yavapaiensis KR-236]|uniref:Uncharacterized protein DUF1275 n=1 Tax=Deinococcus yavapaiensis KR-236 TaxID=694435 RepID=A0A318SFM1_9DEIO|nr:uncharacterized protein DUF1275 [Deinococcus yavapaiensis KR-236]
MVRLTEALLLGGAAMLPDDGNELSPAFVLTVLAMGVQNAALSRTDLGNVGVTYVPGTLAKFGRMIAARLTGLREAGREARRLASLWLCFAIGEVGGGLGHAKLGFGALWLPVSVLFALVLWSAVSPKFIEEAQEGSMP